MVHTSLAQQNYVMRLQCVQFVFISISLNCFGCAARTLSSSLFCSSPAVTDGTGVQPEGAGTGCTRKGAGGVQPELLRRSDTPPNSTAEKHSPLEGRGQEPCSGL